MLIENPVVARELRKSKTVSTMPWLGPYHTQECFFEVLGEASEVPVSDKASRPSRMTDGEEATGP